jgi:phosphoribosylanthranilate isomerase
MSSLFSHFLRLPGIPCFMAGGLKPENVAEAIKVASPLGVDVSSSLESAPGVKVDSKIRDFLSQAAQMPNAPTVAILEEES